MNGIKALMSDIEKQAQEAVRQGGAGSADIKRLRTQGKRLRQAMELLDKGMAEDAQRIASEVAKTMPHEPLPPPSSVAATLERVKALMGAVALRAQAVRQAEGSGGS
eukprot:7383714-Prymnesium_polylepis.1